MKCNLDGDTIRHVSGLRTMPHAPELDAVVKTTVPIPASLCPVSGNPQSGSELSLRYRPVGSVLETYSLAELLKMFRNGFPGVGPYRAERNMEGLVHLVCQMCADALGTRVVTCARLNLDTGTMRVVTRCNPREEQ